MEKVIYTFPRQLSSSTPHVSYWRTRSFFPCKASMYQLEVQRTVPVFSNLVNYKDINFGLIVCDFVELCSLQLRIFSLVGRCYVMHMSHDLHLVVYHCQAEQIPSHCSMIHWLLQTPHYLINTNCIIPPSLLFVLWRKWKLSCWRISWLTWFLF